VCGGTRAGRDQSEVSTLNVWTKANASSGQITGVHITFRRGFAHIFWWMLIDRSGTCRFHGLQPPEYLDGTLRTPHILMSSSKSEFCVLYVFHNWISGAASLSFCIWTLTGLRCARMHNLDCTRCLSPEWKFKVVESRRLGGSSNSERHMFGKAWS
jgi:hypothetical protein